MPVKLVVIKIETENWGCDICGQLGDISTLSTVTPTDRVVDDDAGVIRDHWTETDWHLCGICHGLTEARNRLALMQRTEQHADPERASKAIEHVETLMGQLKDLP